jgi:energy-converting hydrogenase Eha subunit A
MYTNAPIVCGTDTIVAANTPVSTAMNQLAAYFCANPGPQGPQGIPGSGFTWTGDYIPGDGYNVDDVVLFEGALWICILATGSSSDPDITPANWDLFLPAAVPTYKIYSALITQTGTANPVVTVVANTLGTVTIVRDNPGRYSVTTSGLFTTNKTVISINTITTTIGLYGGYAGISDSGSTNVFYIDTAKVIGGGSIPGVGADTVLFRTPLEIKVYD